MRASIFRILITITAVSLYFPNLNAQQATSTADTVTIYRNNQKWTSERSRLHHKIVQDFLEGITPSINPKAVYTGGPPGAGKSTVIRQLENHGLFTLNNTVVIDPDLIKEKLPEYQQFKRTNPTQAASLVHEESGIIAEMIFAEALQRQLNVFVDGTLRSYDYFYDVMTKEILSVKYQYHIVAIYIDASLKTLEKRVSDRAQATGRHVPLEYIESTKKVMADSFERISFAADFTYYIENEKEPVFRYAFSVNGGFRTIPINIPLSAFSSKNSLDNYVSTQPQQDAEDIYKGGAYVLAGMPGNIPHQIKLLKSLAQGSSKSVRKTLLWALHKIAVFNSVFADAAESTSRFIESESSEDVVLESMILRSLKTKADVDFVGRSVRKIISEPSQNRESMLLLLELISALIKIYPKDPLIQTTLPYMEDVQKAIPKLYSKALHYEHEGLSSLMDFYKNEIVPRIPVSAPSATNACEMVFGPY